MEQKFMREKQEMREELQSIHALKEQATDQLAHFRTNLTDLGPAKVRRFEHS